MRKGLVAVALLLVLVLATGSAVKASLSSVPDEAPLVPGDGAWETPCQDGIVLHDPDDEVRMSYQTTCEASKRDDGAWETPYQNGVKLFDPDDEVRMTYQTAPMPEPAVGSDAPTEELGCDHPWCCTLPGHVRGHFCLDALFWQTFVPELPGVPDDEGSYCYHVWHYGVLGCDGNYLPGLAPYWLGVVCYGQGPCGSGYAWCYIDTWAHHCGGCWGL